MQNPGSVGKGQYQYPTIYILIKIAGKGLKSNLVQWHWVVGDDVDSDVGDEEENKSDINMNK